jgi:hypothetical protein
MPLQMPLPQFEGISKNHMPFKLDISRLTQTVSFDGLSRGRRDLSHLTRDQRQEVYDWEEMEGFGVGSVLNVFPSGEVSGGCYSRGLRHIPTRSKRLLTESFTSQSRKKIRRAVDCFQAGFKLFLTLTFDPKLSVLTESGVVCQQWAKKHFTQFLDTLRHKYDRWAAKLNDPSKRISYIWVAEVQGNGNIHFHILLNRPFIDRHWLCKIWGQAGNSINLKRLKDQHHATSYMLKYMEKGKCPIEGKRYGLTKDLLDASRPVRYDFYGRSKRSAFLRIKDDLSTQIKQNGGFVSDWGFSIPSPRRPRRYLDPSGNIKFKSGVSGQIHTTFLESLVPYYDSEQPVIYDSSLSKFVELPF